ncbi:MAG: hypothetical protein ACP5VE_12475 [Chthonomonadales bacterium]
MNGASAGPSVLPFDPAAGSVVLEPEGTGPGWWVGAASAVYDWKTAGYYLYYRLRKPRELGRGAECCIARSGDGLHFTPIWRASRNDFQTPSIERGCILHGEDGVWRLYVSYVDREDNRWRTDVMEASEPHRFDPAARKCVFTARDVGVEGVKDPVIFTWEGRFYGLFSYAAAADALSQDERSRMHATADAYNTGLVRSLTGLAVSDDGVHFQWLGTALAPREGAWDGYCARVSSVVRRDPVWIAFYDGSARVEENYEERTGLAAGVTLGALTTLTPEGPILVSPHASGALRYVTIVRGPDCLWTYYEYARPDGSHELRANRLEWD